jgi:hypothetical protein
MKHFLLTTIAAVVLVGCGKPVRELVSEKEAERPEDTIISRESVRELLSEKEAERPEDAIVSRFWGSTPTSSGITRESQMASYFESGKKCIAVAQLGIYGSVAVLNLEPQNAASNNDHIPIKGSYYYVKHAKEIDLNGYLEKKTSRITIKESYQGKATGQIHFSGNNKSENHWLAPGSADKEEASLIHLFSYDSSIEEQDIASMYFKNPHLVWDRTMPKETPPAKLEDRVWACKLPDDSVAFQIYVNGPDFHVGSWNGIALPMESGNELLHQSFPYGGKCEFLIELDAKKKITFKDVDCGRCCGARATLEGEYNYREEIRLFGNTDQLKAEGK